MRSERAVDPLRFLVINSVVYMCVIDLVVGKGYKYFFDVLSGASDSGLHQASSRWLPSEDMLHCHQRRNVSYFMLCS